METARIDDRLTKLHRSKASARRPASLTAHRPSWPSRKSWGPSGPTGLHIEKRAGSGSQFWRDTMKSSSQESSSQPPCSPESPPWPPPTHWPPPAWMRSARSRPWPKQLLSAGRFTSFSLSRREVPLFLSRKRGTSSPSRVVGYFGSHHPRRGTGTFNALRWVPQRSGQPVLCSQVPTRSLLTDSLATPGVGGARGGHNLAPFVDAGRCGICHRLIVCFV